MTRIAIQPKNNQRLSYLKGRLNSIKRSIAARRAELLGISQSSTNSYLLTVRCPRQHVFDISTKNLARGIWCPVCAEIVKQQELDAILSMMRDHAAARLGRCLAVNYTSARSSVVWECADGHQWSTSWDNVRNKETWCPVCAKQKGRT